MQQTNSVLSSRLDECEVQRKTKEFFQKTTRRIELLEREKAVCRRDHKEFDVQMRAVNALLFSRLLSFFFLTFF